MKPAQQKTEKHLLTPQELCRRWATFGKKISVGTLKNWRIKGKGPRATKIGGSVFYSIAEIEAYEQTVAKIS